MANEKNLILFGDMDEEKHREYASKGGKKSGEVRRKKKKMKETINMLLSLELPEGSEAKEQLKSLGIEDEDLNVQTQILMQQVLKAMAGNLSSAEFVREVSDEVGAIKDDTDSNDRIVIIDDLDDLEDLDDEDS